MRISNPFTKLGLYFKRMGQLLRPSPRPKNSIHATRWEDNLTPFYESSGVAHEEFAGKNRLLALKLFLVVVVGILCLRLFQLKVVQGSAFKQQAATNFTRFHQISASRGIIFDSLGTPLVLNEPDYVLSALPAQLPRAAAARDAVATKLSTLLNVPAIDVQTALTTAFKLNHASVPLKFSLSRDQGIEMITKSSDFPGLQLDIESKRNYTGSTAFSQILGYLTQVSDDDLKADTFYQNGDKIGRDGLERYYENQLRGVKGVGEIEVDAKGKQITVRSDPNQLPQSGRNLVLTINKNLQSTVQTALENGIRTAKGAGGVAIVLDVRSGAILAMASAPTYDNNVFSAANNTDAINQLYSPDSGTPLFDRAIAGLYPPGSTFKTITASAGLQEGVIKANTILQTPGFLDVGGSKFIDWIYGASGGNFGSLNVVGALTHSSDVFFYQVAAGYNQLTGLGSDRLKHYADLFGLESQTGIDLPGEKKGVIPSQSEYAALQKDWYWGDTAHAGIGQGYVLVTPLELCDAIAAIANGGTLYQPYLVKSIETSGTDPQQVTAPKVTRANVVSSSVLQTVRQGMRGTVNDPGGTAPQLKSLPVIVAGKTGTAQTDKIRQNHAWFVSFAPYDNPQIATVVLVEQGGEGSQTAVPITKEILAWYFTNLSH